MCRSVPLVLLAGSAPPAAGHEPVPQYSPGKSFTLSLVGTVVPAVLRMGMMVGSDFGAEGEVGWGLAAY